MTVASNLEATYDLTSQLLKLKVESTLAQVASSTTPILENLFTVEVKNICRDSVLTAPQWQENPYNYKLWDTQSIEFDEAVDVSANSCGTFTYKLYDASNDQEVSSIWTIDASDPAAPTVNATPTTTNLVGTHLFYVIAQNGPYEFTAKSPVVTVVIWNPCYETVFDDSQTLSDLSTTVKLGSSDSA